MRNIIKQKKAISVIVGYVLLITISLALSMLVYVWMKRQTPAITTECPDTLSLMIQDYICNNETNTLNLTIKNNGLYNIQGAIIKVSNSSMLPIYPLIFKESIPIDKIKNLSNIEYQFIGDLNASGSNPTTLIFDYSIHNKLTEISILPLYYEGKEKIVCSSQEVKQDLNNCD
jgi:hypothetical protein